MSTAITVTRNGTDIEIYDDDDVQNLFEQDAGIAIGDSVEEWKVVGIDAELDQVKDVGPVFRIYCYFKGIATSATIGETDLSVSNWERKHNILSDDGKFGVVYEVQP